MSIKYPPGWTVKAGQTLGGYALPGGPVPTYYVWVGETDGPWVNFSWDNIGSYRHDNEPCGGTTKEARLASRTIRMCADPATAQMGAADFWDFQINGLDAQLSVTPSPGADRALLSQVLGTIMFLEQAQPD